MHTQLVYMYYHTHTHTHTHTQSIEISDDELKNLIDSILRDDDLNDDGYIDYYEFVQAQRDRRAENVA